MKTTTQKHISSKPKFAYVSFLSLPNVIDEMYKIKKYSAFFDFLYLLKNDFNITVFDYIGKTISFKHNGIRFNYIKKRFNFKWYLPFKTFWKLRKLNPDIVYVQGLSFPHFVIFIRLFLKSSTKILIHDHANIPPKNWKKLIYKWADKYINTYFFTSKNLAKPWVESGVISSQDKIIECIEGSTQFKYDSTIKKDKNSFLWVGRLDENKDPITVLKAFSEYIKSEPKANLNMFYENTSLLHNVQDFITKNSLHNHVNLMGNLAHENLEEWFQKSTYFILGSHKEGGPIALIEAMACGCIPIITKIPAFVKMTKSGRYGFLFTAKNDEELIKILLDLKNVNHKEMISKIVAYFEKEMSHEAIAETIRLQII
jgi:glycosyltransferase involved in cell wall biosynthesis